MENDKKLFFVDAYSLIYRFYYAFMNRPMRNAQGLNTSPMFGFTIYIRDIIRREKPHYLGVAFDTKGPTFRHELYAEYKANREATPEDIRLAVPYIKQIVKAMHIPILEMEGWEADDIIGTLATKASKQGYEVYMVTPDKDFGQLIKPNVYMYKQRTGGEGVEIVGVKEICETYGIDDPRKVIDILALWGDVSDNIPGVPGIGEKWATRLVNRFGPVENLLENTDKLSGKQKENVIASREQLVLSKKLATIDVDAPIEFKPEQLVVEHPNVEALKGVFNELGFNMFLRELESGEFFETSSKPANTPTSGRVKENRTANTETARVKSFTGQGTLFDMGEGGAGEAETLSDNRVERQAEVLQEMDTIEGRQHSYHTVDSDAELDRLVELLSKSKEFCFDSETTGLDVFNDQMVGLSFAVEKGEAWYVPLNRENREERVAMFKPLFESDEIAKVGQNIKFDMMMLANVGVQVRGFKYDTMLLHYLLDPESRHGVNFLARKYLNYQMVEIESLIGRGAKRITMDMVAVERVAQYACEDADITMQLKEVLWTSVVGEQLEKLYREIEEPMIDVLVDIELIGVKLDREVLGELSGEMNAEMRKVEQKICEIAEEPELNVNSPMQLGEVLFEKLKIDSNPRLTRTKRYRTDEEYLQSLSSRHPIIEHILEYRGLKKLLSTYIDALPELINSKTNRIHTSYNQAVTATGRLSSSNPNLQNIPIRTAAGREIRRAFIATDDDHLLLSADYSQVELRLMAHLSEDKNMLDAFQKGEDIHSSTASRLFKTPLAEVNSDQRRKAKTANFGIIYGISPFGLSQRLSIPRAEAQQIIGGYFESYPCVSTYIERVIAEAGEKGYVETIFGRKRWLNDINSRNANTRGMAERNAINAPIQGSAADIMKIAMVNIYRRFRSEGLKSQVIMQVHDELVVNMLRSEKEQVVAIVIGEMAGAAKLKVELVVDYKIAKNWLEAN